MQVWGSCFRGPFRPVTPPPAPGLPPLLPAESKAFASNLPTLSVVKAAAPGPGKSSGLQVRGRQNRGLGLELRGQSAGQGACGGQVGAERGSGG